MPWLLYLVAGGICLGLAFLLQLFGAGRTFASYVGMMFTAAQAMALVGFGAETLLRKTGVFGRGEVSVAGVALGAVVGLGLGLLLAPYAVRHLWVYWTMAVVGTLFVLSWFTGGLTGPGFTA